MMRITTSQIQFFVYAATTTLVSASKTFLLKLFVGGGLKKIALDLEDVKLLQGCQNKHECKNYLRTEKSVANWNNKKTVLSSNTTAAQHGVTHSWGTHPFRAWVISQKRLEKSPDKAVCLARARKAHTLTSRRP